MSNVDTGAPRSFWKAFGPGILFTGAAVGVSHLVQSTRAGAEYGLALLAVVVIANLMKYPAFRFGPQYAAATGTSLLEGYRRQGRWALWLYAVLTVGSMFTVQAAVTLVTAGLAKVLFGISASPVIVSGVLLAICATLIGAGRYHWLDRIAKVVVAVLTVSTLLATALALPRLDWAHTTLSPASALSNAKGLFFVAALVGWMPSAIDVSVWQSLWTLARRDDTGHRPSRRDSLLDFHVGYFGTAFLALCFLVLGATVMHGRGVAFAHTAGGFAAQVIALYTDTLGAWSGPVIATAAFATMFSTTLTVLDGFPRALAVLVARFRDAEVDAPEAPTARRGHRGAYLASLIALSVGSLVLISHFVSSLAAMVDLATTLSFLSAPVLSWLSHRAVQGTEVPADARPRPWLVRASWLGIALQAALALGWLWLRLAP